MNKKTTCPTCGGNTTEYIYRFDVLDAVLLLAMAREVQNRKTGRMKEFSFTVQNRVHVPSLEALSLAVRCRTTMCSKLGLIAKAPSVDTGRQEPGYWLITARGWAALRGELVPASVAVFRKQITERPDEKITISEAFKVNNDNLQAAIARKIKNGTIHKARIVSYRMIEEQYHPEEWVEYGKPVAALL
jgi:hypothetical protein